jgi:hypothetical protein
MQIVLLTHRNAFGYIDEWFDLSFEEVPFNEILHLIIMEANVTIIILCCVVTRLHLLVQ